MEAPKAKILVVDDERNVLLTVAAILRQEGYDVDAVDNGAEALRTLGERKFDLVLTDLKMPDVDGLDVLRAAHTQSPSTVTVVMTGYGSVDSAMEAVQLGAYEYLLKPTEVAELKQAVKRSLERKRLSEIDTLYRVSQAITGAATIDTVAAEVTESVRTVLGVAHASLATMSGDHNACDVALRDALSDPQLRERLQSGAVITQEDELERLRAWRGSSGIHSFVLVPGIGNRQLVCALCVDNGPSPYEFHASALRFLQSLAGQAALALENSFLIAELKKNNQELAEANRKLKELDQLKSKFLSVATHELRTPLTVILGYNAMLEESLSARLGPEEQETLHESVSACKRLIRLVNSMLDVSMIESGRMQINFAPTDLRHIVNSVVVLFQNEARSRHLQLKVELPLRMPKANLDAERIQQVIINLVGNAMKFTLDGGTISVGVRQRADQQLELWVSDTGVGIPAGEQDRIFDEFTQVRQAKTKGKREGTGLGLAIARRIVEAHDGKISVSSVPGQGSTFTVILPIQARHSTVKSAMTA